MDLKFRYEHGSSRKMPNGQPAHLWRGSNNHGATGPLTGRRQLKRTQADSKIQPGFALDTQGLERDFFV